LRVKKAVIPAAGLGTRFLPVTKAVPKELLPVVNKPVIQHVIEEAAASGIGEAIFVVSSGKDAILDHFDALFEIEDTLRRRGTHDLLRELEKLHDLISIVSVRQKQALGLGHAIYTARNAVGNEPFAVLLADDLVDAEVPCIRQMIDVYDRTGAAVVGVMKVPREEIPLYGIVKGVAEGPRLIRVEEMVEKPSVEEAPSDLAIVGRYVLTPDIFEALEKTKPGSGGEIQITDALDALAREKGVIAYEFEGDRYDVGDQFGFVHANVVFAMREPGLRARLEGILEKLLRSR
jgi:UTP--glucose-1-phosphate uridylyltransferase